MVSSKDEVLRIVDGFLDLLRRTHDVRRAYLFGSFAKGTAKDYSNVDLTIVPESLDQPEESPFNEAFRIFHGARNHNSLLEVVDLTREEFDGDGASLVRRTKKEGIRLL